jgi:hypothetical protein
MTTRCPHCHSLVPKPPSRMIRRLALGGAWIVVMAMVFGASLIGPFVIAILPFMVFAGIALVTAAYEFAHADRICAVCGRAYELDGERVEPAVAVETRPIPALSHA